MPLPTFLVAGAQRCGTSTLAAYLRRHPKIHMAKPKELHFFDLNLSRGLEWYMAQFAPKKQHLQWGEATPIYMFDPQSRELMARVLPDCKHLIILRNPTQRAYSHYWHARRRENEMLDSFEMALDREKTRLATGERDALIYHSYLSRGEYIDQIEAMEQAFGRDRLHVMLFEDLVKRRTRTLRQAFGFLEVSRRPAATIDEVWASHRHATTTPSAGDEADDGSKTTTPYPPMRPETKERLLAHFAPYNDRLGHWLGRDLSDWNTA